MQTPISLSLSLSLKNVNPKYSFVGKGSPPCTYMSCLVCQTCTPGFSLPGLFLRGVVYLETLRDEVYSPQDKDKTCLLSAIKMVDSRTQLSLAAVVCATSIMLPP